jgi:L-ascorbate metabolism protein UlaG (beta-lactamase superfamily)
MPDEKRKIKLEWFGHSCFRFEIEGKHIFFDPMRRNNLLDTTLDPDKEENVSAVFISHDHWDHDDNDTIIALCNKDTHIYCPPSVALSISHRMTFESEDIDEHQNLTRRIHTVEPEDVVDLGHTKVKCLEASEGISYLLIHDKKILYMGDSVATEEMIKEKPDVILFPVWAVRGGEAKLDEFLELASSALCIPMHYHTNTYGLPNFYIDENELEKLVPGNVNMRIVTRNKVLEI